MHELQEVAERIHELRIALNAYGDSDASVVAQARARIFERSAEVRHLYEEIRLLKQAAPSPRAAGEGAASEGEDDG